MFKKNTKIKKFKKSHFIAQKRYDNPFFRHKKKNSNNFLSVLSLKSKLIVSFVLVTLVVVLLFLVYSSFFSIREINVNIHDQNEISTLRSEDIKKNISNLLTTKIIFFPKDNLMLLNINKLTNELKESFAFDYIKITKNYPKILNVDIKEVEYAVIWSEKEKFYYVSPVGKIIKEVEPIEIKNIFPSIYNYGGELISDGWVESREQLIVFAIKMHNKIKEETDFQIDRFEIDPNSSKSINVFVLNGPKLIFDIEKDIDQQFEKLTVVKNERLKNNFFSKEYIDLRYGDMIYIR